MEKKIVAVIPARYGSSRLHGKPLLDINGKPMLWWVYQEAKKVDEYFDIIVATESEEVVKVCDKYSIKVILTSDNHKTGTDRVAEVAQKIEADLYICVFGDEPLLKAEEQRALIKAYYSKNDAEAMMLARKITNPVEIANPATVKLAINDEGYLIFMSREAIPHPKATTDYFYYKHVGCYAFKKSALNFFLSTKLGNIEKAEGNELMRLLENHKKVLTVLIDSDSVSVDTEKELIQVRQLMSRRDVS